jgi:hypothetical protein
MLGAAGPLGSRCIGVHIAAGGRHVDEDEDGTPALAGAGIDSGGDGILVDLDLGGWRTAIGAVVRMGRCGGRGGGRICLRRRRGARGPSKARDEVRREDNRDNLKRQSTIIPANSANITVSLFQNQAYH